MTNLPNQLLWLDLEYGIHPLVIFSYEFYEKSFLKLKKRYTTVENSDVIPLASIKL